jgi:farnesyl-diphosphate farnesyltransferase
MILDALRHVTDALDYLKLLKNQSVFNFCAIPATMAIATLSLCFSNPAMFQRNIKIRKATAARLIMRSTNPREVAAIFREYARDIHARLDPKDPSFLKLGVCLGRIESWMERNYPTFVHVVDYTAQGGQPQVEFQAEDVRSRIFRDAQKRNLQVISQNQLGVGKGGFNEKGLPEGFPALSDEPESASNVKAGESNELMLVVAGAIIAVLAIAFGAVWVVLRFVPVDEVVEKVVSASGMPKVEL